MLFAFIDFGTEGMIAILVIGWASFEIGKRILGSQAFWSAALKR